MSTRDILAGFPALSPSSEVIFETKDHLSRWSNTEVSPNGCAAIVVPCTEEDIVAVVKFATNNGFKVLPTAGKHGSYLPINERSIYLDMKNFKDIALDTEVGCVKISGGVLGGELCSALAEKGWYSSYPNSNAVGMVGYVLGGGSSIVNSIYSLAIDNLLAVRILTASGVFLTLTSDSVGGERDLFNVICGAGFGFGIVTSITLKAWRISDLGLDNDKVWTRRLVFYPSAIDKAADIFAELSSPPPEMAVTLLFMRAPPSAPYPGAPMIMLIITYLGPAKSAEEACKAAFEPKHIAEATIASTTSVDITSLNTAAEPLNRHGDYKSNYSTWAHSIDREQIQSGFTKWLQLGESNPDAEASSYFVISVKNPACMLAHDVDEEKFFPRAIRGRSIFIQAVPWWTEVESEEKSRGWAKSMLEILGERSTNDETVNGFAANMNKDVDLVDIWPEAKIEEIKRLKAVWDSGNLFWNPVVDGM